MAIQIVMDLTGDSRHHFDPSDAQEVAEAERQSRELTNAGFTDATRSSPGQVTQLQVVRSWRRRNRLLSQVRRQLIR